MGERIIIPAIPETQTTPERAFWDAFIGGLEALAGMTDEIDMQEVLAGFEGETGEDAVTLLYNYYLQITVQDDTSSDLETVEQFLRHNHILE